jgi:ribosomal protein S18 acetylase RimI-like enzyme
MAAVPEARVPELAELSGVPVKELEPVLEEETRAWRRELEWDFTAAADQVRRLVESGSLAGYALGVAGRTVGYSYHVADEHKSLIGDLFLVEEHRTAENERILLGAVLGASMRTRGVRRIESQLMLLRWTEEGPLPGAKFLQHYPRNLMLVEAAQAGALRPRTREDHIAFDRWTERRQDETAQLIAAAYRGHLDSQINDQYRSAAGARRFLCNIVQYPGCGVFYPPACWVAVDEGTGRMCGASLSSLVAREVGHITQICVAPAARGRGVGYELLRRSVESLGQSGTAKVSLTVTAANETAVQLYRRMGFRVVRRFQALVWEGF